MAAELLILPSSPPRQFTKFSMSSSPPLPSLDDIMPKGPSTLRTGSRAVSIPQNASASFTSAASLLKSTSTLDAIDSVTLEDDAATKTKAAKTAKARKAPVKKADSESKITKKPRKPAATDGEVDTGVAEKKTRKPRTKKNSEEDPGGLEKSAVASKPRAKKAEPGDPGPAVAKEKPARKPRAKKAEGEPQTKLSKGKVTKASANAEGKSGLANTQVVRLKCESPTRDLAKAVKRRAGWTPPAPSEKTGGFLSESILNPGIIDSGKKRTGFSDLLGSYGFTKLENSSVPAPIGSEVTRKRKLIELVKSSVMTLAAISPVAKEKAPKKKAKTLTDQATSAYTEEEEEDPNQPAPLLQYFSVQTTERPNDDGFKIPAKPRSKSPVKSTSKSKKGSAQAPILLSPESAMKQVGNQDFVFGTSSQLAREDSPTLLRDLHAAMQASNAEDDPFADSVFDSSPPIPKRRTGITPKRNLWSAASRDDSGEFLDVPMIDLVDSPAIIFSKPASAAVMATPVQPEIDIWHDIGTTPAAAATYSDQRLDIWHEIGRTPAGKAVSSSPIVPGPIEEAIRTDLLSSPSGSRPAKSPRKPKDDCLLPDVESPSKEKAVKSPAKGKKLASSQIPNFAAYTDAQLTKEIASYRFKPIKKREQMITLLEKCWKSKHESALSNLSTNMPIIPPKVAQDVVPPSSRPPKASPKRPRGRPRKESTVQYLEMDSDTPLSQSRTPKRESKKPAQHREDISDSDASATPSPPRRKASQISPLPLKRLSSDLSDIPELSPDAAQKLLFKHIHMAITSASRSTDPMNPSWHEKILLYDPIVLEDLTVWLNTGGLGKVGWDGEVEPKLVKKWCESKSICCLWRENLRGAARSRC